MKKILSLLLFLMIPLTLVGCDIIEQEIQRAESIELEDYLVDIPNRTVYLKITSDADEPVIEDVVINDTQYALIDEGNDWYRLDEVPIATAYNIGSVYYRTGVGVRLSFGLNHDIKIKDALDFLPDEQLTQLDQTLTFDAITFTPSETELVDIDGDEQITIDVIDDWVWLVLDDEVPVYVVVDIEGDIYVITVPDDLDDYLK